MSIRSFLYKAARILGDANAIKRGKIAQRVVHKTETRVVSKLVRKVIKW